MRRHAGGKVIEGREGGREGGRDVQLGYTGALHLAIKFKIVLAIVSPGESRYVPRHIHLRWGEREGGRGG